VQSRSVYLLVAFGLGATSQEEKMCVCVIKHTSTRIHICTFILLKLIFIVMPCLA